jgi:FOG: WD40 repeat
MEIPKNRLFRIFTIFLLWLLTSCGKTNTPIPNVNTISPSAMALAMPTESRTITPTPSLTATQTPMVTLSSYPTISYPLKPGPVLTRENAGQAVLLGTIQEKLNHTLGDSQLAWSPDGKELALTTDGDGVRFIDPLTMKEVGEIRQDTEGIVDTPGGIAYSPDGIVFAESIPAGVFSNPGDIVFYGTKTHNKIRDNLNIPGAHALTYNHGGDWIAFDGHTVGSVIDLATDKEIYYFGEDKIEFDFVLFSWDDKYFAFSGNGHPVTLVETNDWKLVNGFDGGGGICFSPDNKWFASKSGIWSLMDFKLTKELGDNYYTERCDFGKENDILINIDSHNDIQIWDILGGELLNSLKRNDNVIYNMALSTDGKFIVSTDYYDDTVNIWGIPG